MEWQAVINLGAGAVLSIVGWFVKEVHSVMKEQRRDFEAHKVEVAKEYVTRSHLDGTLGDIKDTLRRIEDKLDGKADKP